MCSEVCPQLFSGNHTVVRLGRTEACLTCGERVRGGGEGGGGKQSPSEWGLGQVYPPERQEKDLPHPPPSTEQKSWQGLGGITVGKALALQTAALCSVLGTSVPTRSDPQVNPEHTIFDKQINKSLTQQDLIW